MNDRVASVDGEEAILLIHEHWTRFAPAILLVLLSWMIYALCGFLAIVFATRNQVLSLWIVVIGHIVLLLFHHAAFYRYLSMSTRQFLLTNRRIIGSEQHILFSDDTLDIPLYRIRSIEAKEQGVFQHILRFGTLVLNRGDLPSLHSIPQPDVVHDAIMAQVQRLLPTTSHVQQKRLQLLSIPVGVS